MPKLLASIILVATLSITILPSQNLAVARPMAEAQAQTAGADEDAPVPVPSPGDKALAYYRSGNVLWIVGLLWGLVVPAAFVFTGFSARLRAWAHKLGRKWFFVVGIYFVVFAVLMFLLDLPLSYYEGFVREHAYGLSNQTFAKWFGDEVKGLAVGLLAGLLFLWIPYLVVRKSPRRWWLYISLLAIPFMIFVMVISPVWIDPLFNEFGPMTDKALELKILALAQRAGIEGGRVYEVKKSVDTSAVNAYVTGFFHTKRIVLWDTILAKLDEKEVLVVMGHEMGHYVLHHILTGMIFSFFLILAALYLTCHAGDGLVRRHRNRVGFESLADIASLPLFLALIGVFSFALSPIAMAFSRYQEHEADRFALEITRDNHDAATAFVKLQQENLSIPRPGPLYRFWRLSHPAIGDRIDFCNTYRPWRSGQPLKYGDRFR